MKQFVKTFAPWVCLSFVMALVPAITPAQTQSTAPASKPATATHPHPAATTPRPDPALLHPATLTAKAPDVYEVTFKTSAGDFVVQVTRAWAPLGADRFYNLVKHGFFTDASFFRVVPGFMVQFGLNARPAVNAAWEKANIKDDPVTQSNKPGYITFATAGPNTRTTQVFINYQDNAALDPQGFAPFGKVISGMDVVQKIYGEYGDGAPSGRGPDQSLVTTQGKTYLDKNFPKLDHIISATVTSPVPTPTVHTTPARKVPTATPAAKPE